MPATPYERKKSVAAPLAFALLVAAACDQKSPTAIDDTRLPGEPVTLEIQLNWDQFGSGLAVFGGYGHPSGTPETLIARSFGGTVDARTLVRFAPYPTSATVTDSLGTTRTDSDLTYFGGYVVAVFDTIASSNTGPVSVALGSFQEEWDAASATWTSAVDSVGDRRPWSEVGAGPVTLMDSRTWDPALGDSVQFFLDSAEVAAWADPADKAKGGRIEVETDGQRLHLNGVALRLSARSSINPDTILTLSVGPEAGTFIYTPDAAPPTDGMRIGGAPAWRTVLDLDLPVQLTGPQTLCDAVGCPFVLSPGNISYAGLLLTSRSTEAGFQPTDSLSIDLRAVLSPAALPKSPLGGSLIADPRGVRLAPEAFGPQAGQVVAIPITAFVKGFLAGPDAAGRPPASTLALLSAAEPGAFSFASFYGPGVPEEPVLSLIVTVSPPMEFR